jgi:hypothetical protein
MPAEPVLKKFKNIECRDAVLAYDGEPEPARDEAGNMITVWDRKSTKKDSITGRDVPDETKRVPLLTYKNPRPAEWPAADFIVGNPPFIGSKYMRCELGDGYAETLREIYPGVSESADFVMYWWHKAGDLVRAAKAKRFGLITTNSLRHTFNRRIVQEQLCARPPLSLVFAIADHPWVDTVDGAAVRIAMTVGAEGEQDGDLLEVADERPQVDGSSKVAFTVKRGRISADITTETSVAAISQLRANERLSYRGVQLIGSGFIITPDKAKSLGLGRDPRLEAHIRTYRNGKDATDEARGVMTIDLLGLGEREVRERFPAVYQHVLTCVKPERDQNKQESYRRFWWVFGEPRKDLRPALAGLSRFIASPATAKHRFFVFLSEEVLPDDALITFALEDAFFLGVLSSRVHVVFTLATGATLEDRPRYNQSRCFDPFPFPACDAATQARIRKTAEELDAHRKRVQSQNPGLTLTGMYNVLEKLRAGEALSRVYSAGACAKEPQRREERREKKEGEGAQSDYPSVTDSQLAGTGRSLRPSRLCGLPALPSTASLPLSEKEKQIHDAGLVSVLRQLHDDLDGAVFAAYGWPPTLTDAEILERLVALNAERAKEEASGLVRWLRPDYQNPGRVQAQQTALAVEVKPESEAGKKRVGKLAWPKTLSARVKAVSTALAAVKEPVTAPEMAKRFARARAAEVGEILETLCAVGKARRGHGQGTFLP